jgi:hypothetical protein
MQFVVNVWHSDSVLQAVVITTYLLTESPAIFSTVYLHRPGYMPSSVALACSSEAPHIPQITESREDEGDSLVLVCPQMFGGKEFIQTTPTITPPLLAANFPPSPSTSSLIFMLNDEPGEHSAPIPLLCIGSKRLSSQKNTQTENLVKERSHSDSFPFLFSSSFVHRTHHALTLPG